ncbi:MAG: amidohydrolase family protein [Woeseiaceae bacterium]|nr:amidohydrolase family protein [Woeseiaceae bacterium]
MRTLVLMLLAGSSFAGETAIHNVSGYTSTTEGIREFSVLVFADDGRVVATGGESLLKARPDAIRIDGNGRTLLPGLTDGHAHLYNYGFLQQNLDLAGTPSLTESLLKINAYAKENPHSRWIQGRGWNQVLWPIKEFPTAADIDAVVSDRPVLLDRIDGHAVWANSRAMEIAGITDDTPDPVGGRIVRDTSGKATGVFIDKAEDLLKAQIPQPDWDEIREVYRTAFAGLAPYGITGVHDAGVTIREVEVLISMADDRELGLRVYAMLDGADEVLDQMEKPLKRYAEDMLDIRAVKLYSDGALGSRGAAMIEPYSDDPENRGLPFFTTEDLTGLAHKANYMGFQVGIHAIGDLGNRMALDAFDAIQGGKPSMLRNRIEHAQVIDLPDIPRFAELGVIAAMQATHATSDMNMAEDRVGPIRIRGAYAWRRLLDSGAMLANGSDFPVELANPWHGLYASVTRKSREGLPEGGWYADQGLTRAEALHSFTLANAYAAHQEDYLGSLEPGKWADFIMIDRDYFEVPESEIDDIQVLETWIAGERVYSAEEAQ